MLVYIFTCLFVFGEDTRHIPASSHFRVFHISGRFHMNYASTCFNRSHITKKSMQTLRSRRTSIAQRQSEEFGSVSVHLSSIECSAARLIYWIFHAENLLQIPRWQQHGYFFMFI